MFELKKFFDLNYSQIFLIFYESFLACESNIRAKTTKLNKEELESVLFIFHKILLLQPERIHLRWQARSIGRIIQKLLHIGNTKSIKFYGIRYFLIWYQILNMNKTQVEELMFQRLVQGFDAFYSASQTSDLINSSIGIDMLSAEAHKVFNQNQATSNDAAINRSIYPFEISPIIPYQANESLQIGTSTTASSSVSSSSSSAFPSSMSSSSATSAGASLAADNSSLLASHINSNSVYSLTAEMLKKMLEFMQQDVRREEDI